MGISKNKVHRARIKKLPTKRQITRKKIIQARKYLQHKIQLKRGRKSKLVSLKNRKKQQAQNQIIDYSTKNQVNGQVTNQQNYILSMLGIGQNQEQWEKDLQRKLQELNSESIDNPQVRRVYAEIGKIFATYRSGKVPKAFKIIPNLQKWEEIIGLTSPQKWTPQAMYQAVNVFSSNLDPIRAEKFYQHYLSPAIRQDLQKNKKLNYHYYESLKKALYKTNAWFKGILFQFCHENTNMKQIKVLQSLLTKMKIPVISSSVAIIKLTQMNPTTAIFHYLFALVSKHYNFPKRIISTIINYLLKFNSYQQELPVVWHQFILNFVKQYLNGISQMEIEALSQLVKKKSHRLITQEILKVLSQSS